MKIIIKIGIFLLNIIYSIFKLFKVKNKITFISRQSNTPNIDFILLSNELKSEYEIIMLCKTLDKGIFNKIKYIFHMFKQMYHIATSKVIILDTYCIPIGVLKHRKNLKVIQMWHALGAFKKFGKSIIGKGESTVNIDGVNKLKMNDLSEIMGMHKNYNYIFASSKKASEGFSEAFGYDKKYIKVLPLPRVDLIIDKKHQKEISDKIYKKYKNLKNKKNILYCPTFRKDGSDYKYIQDLIEKIDYSKYNLILKLHPLTNYDFNDKRIIIDNDFDTYEMAFISDYIITDYSAVIFEISLLNKPIYLYAYDKDSYVNKRDFYLNYDKDMPGEIYDNIEELLSNIDKNKYDKNKLIDFKERYISNCKNSYTSDIVEFIKSIIE